MTAERARRYRSKWLASVVCVGLAAACGSREAAPAALSAVTLPPASPTLDLAVRILREGAAALPEDEPAQEVTLEPPPEPGEEEAFEVGAHEPTSITQAARLGPSALRDFLTRPWVESAVQWGCWRTDYPMEERLVALLGSVHDEDRALALSVLVRVRAPRHILRQWQVLHELDRQHGGDRIWSPLLAALHEPFATDQLEAVLRRDPPADASGSHQASEWAIRAVGVTGCRQLLSRVVVWTRSADVDVAMAAEHSLAEFVGPDADQALADCLGNFGIAGAAAGHELLRRDPTLLIRTLLAADVPDSERRAVGLLLAKLEHPAAVPHLCASVGGTAIVDRAMFAAIERLATVDHWPLVAALPSTVRPEQQERATAVVAAVRARLKL